MGSRELYSDLESAVSQNNLTDELRAQLTHLPIHSDSSVAALWLIAAGAITLDSRGFVVVDSRKAMGEAGALLEALESRCALENDSTPLLETCTTIFLRQTFRESLKALYQSGLVSGVTLGKVSRLIKPSDVLMGDDHKQYGEYLQHNLVYPPEQGNRDKLVIGPGIVRSLLQMVDVVLAEESLGLPSEQKLYVVVWLLLFHEYGHAVDRYFLLAKERLRREEASRLRPHERLKLGNVRSEHYTEVFLDIGYDERLYHLLTLTNVADQRATRLPEESSVERIAMGFEMYGLTLVLQQLGVEPEVIERVLTSMKQRNEERQQEEAWFVSFLLQRGFTLDRVQNAMAEIGRMYRDRIGQDWDTLGISTIGVVDLGYAQPLTPYQLEIFIQRNEARVKHQNF